MAMPNLPEEIILDILLRLPITSLVARFKFPWLVCLLRLSDRESQINKIRAPQAWTEACKAKAEAYLSKAKR
ncbi:hypothetical protein CsSME_00033383 [Camellia sinensis var. sinensis]